LPEEKIGQHVVFNKGFVRLSNNFKEIRHNYGPEEFLKGQLQQRRQLEMMTKWHFAKKQRRTRSRARMMAESK
jgi:hypothetical protein